MPARHDGAFLSRRRHGDGLVFTRIEMLQGMAGFLEYARR